MGCHPTRATLTRTACANLEINFKIKWRTENCNAKGVALQCERCIGGSLCPNYCRQRGGLDERPHGPAPARPPRCSPALSTVRATFAAPRVRARDGDASGMGVARACSSFTRVLTCEPPPVRGCGRRAPTRYIKLTLMLKLCAGYSISPYAACHLNGHARVRNTA